MRRRGIRQPRSVQIFKKGQSRSVQILEERKTTIFVEGR